MSDALQFTIVHEDGDDGWVIAQVKEVPGAVSQGAPEICRLVGDKQDNFPTLTWRCQALERCAKILQREYGVNLRPQLGH